MAFGNNDPIDRRNHERIRRLEIRNLELEAELRSLTSALERSTSMTQGQKEQRVLAARAVLGDAT